MRTSSLVLALLLTASPVQALPDGILEVGAGGAVGAVVGGLVAGGTALVLADQGQSLSGALGVDDSLQQLLLDFYALPAAGALVGAGVGALAVSAWQGHPCSPAVGLAPLGAGVVGGACSVPGLWAAGVAFDEADQADNCGEACGAAIVGLVYGAVGVASFCVGAPVGAGLGGAGGAALVAPEVPPAPPSPPPPASPPPALSPPDAPAPDAPAADSTAPEGPAPGEAAAPSTDDTPPPAPDAAGAPAGPPPAPLETPLETTTPTDEPSAS